MHGLLIFKFNCTSDMRGSPVHQDVRQSKRPFATLRSIISTTAILNNKNCLTMLFALATKLQPKLFGMRLPPRILRSCIPNYMLLNNQKPKELLISKFHLIDWPIIKTALNGSLSLLPKKLNLIASNTINFTLVKPTTPSQWLCHFLNGLTGVLLLTLVNLFMRVLFIPVNWPTYSNY